jgi:hypothetical protein
MTTKPHVWVVEIENKGRWIPTANESPEYKVAKGLAKRLACFAVDVRVVKYVREEKRGKR